MNSRSIVYIFSVFLLVISTVFPSADVAPNKQHANERMASAELFQLPGVRHPMALSPAGGSAQSEDDFNAWRRARDLPPSPEQDQETGKIASGTSVKNDVSPPLRELRQLPPKAVEEHEANGNPKISRPHTNYSDPVVQSKAVANAMPTAIRNFDGIPTPGVACFCSPPDTDGEVGATQYVQMVNEGYQVFNKSTGASVLGPSSIVSLWSGFGGVCENNGSGDPVVIYDQLAGRWIITQFAGTSVPTDECIAVSTTSDATGSYNRYDFHLGSNFFDYPHLSVWPDAYYMSDNVFDSAGSSFLGPQAFAFDRQAMLAGSAATFVTSGLLGSSLGAMLPGDLDGSILPPAGAPNPFVMDLNDGSNWRLYRFHVDFATPTNSTFTFNTLTGAGYTELCGFTRSCVPQPGTSTGLDGIGDRPMFRLAYRRFGDGHEALVGNKTVSAGGVAGIRWFEINNATSGTPTFVQQSTYQPDTTWRWMGSAAMDASGNMALGFSASSDTVFPGVRYAGRLVTDPVNTLGQGETTLIAGGGVQTSSGNRWGDYSDMTIDPLDDCTFWYTQEYYSSTASVNWKTRIGSFKFPSCVPPAPQPQIQSGGPAVITAEGLNPPNGAPDPGEEVTANFPLKNVGTGSTTNLVATLQTSGGVTAIPTGENQNYGVVVAGGATVSKPFTFRGDGSCGGTITATLHLQDGAADLGNVTYDFHLGAANIVSQTFFNAGAITINDGAPAAPYPSNISVSGTPTTITNLTVTLNGFNHTWPDDVDILLVSPAGRKMIIFSDAGGSIDASNANITLDDAASSALPDSTAISTGTYRPANYETVQDAFATPAPASPYLTPAPGGTDTLTSAFTGVAGGNPNGTWSLYVVDDVFGDVGNFAGGWSLTLGSTTYTCVGSSSLRIDTISPPAGRTSGNQPIRLTGAFAGLSSVTMGGVSAAWFYTNGGGDTSTITVTTPAHATGAVTIGLTPSSGGGYFRLNGFAYLPTVFTDDTIFAAVTIAKGQHVIELRQAVDAMRLVAGLTSAPWTDLTLSPTSTIIKAVHILELRTNLNDAANRLGFATSSYSDPTLTTGFLIKRVHIEELRQRIRTIAG